MTDSDDAGSLSPRERRKLTRVRSDRTMIATLAGTGLIAAFMQTLVTPIIPRLPVFLDSSTADASWVLTSTLLAAAISTPISGRLGDMYGKRRIVLILLALLVTGSVISALSNTLIPMVVGRVLQGFGLGVIALGISILRDVIHPKNLGGAVALVSATLGIGGALGLPLAALIADNLDWHFLFWLGGALGLLAIVLVATIIPVSTLRTGGRFDFAGALGLAIGLVCVLLAISKATTWGLVALGLGIAGLVVLAIWGYLELRIHDPLIDLRVAARRPVLLTNLASISVGFAFFVVSASLPVVLEAPVASGVGLGLPLLIASLCLMPLGIAMFFVSPFAARVTAARGARFSLILGGLIITVGFAFGTVLLDEVWHALLVSTITGIGVGFAYAAMPTLIMQSVPPTETAASNGLNSVMRTLGSSIAATIVGIILSSQLIMVGEVAVPSRASFAWVFAVGTAVALAGVIVGLFIPRRSPNYDTSSIPIQTP